MISEKHSILLVEDEALIAMMEKKELENIGYIVHHISTGEKALKTILENSFAVDLILMDIDLGSGIDGTIAAEEILNHKDIPIVFLSSHTEPEIVEKTEKITSYGYVVKNTGIVVLDASIKMALKLFESKSKRIQAEKELLEREETFHILFEGSVKPLLLMKDGIFIECNKATLNFLGITDKERFIGSNPMEISPERQPDGRLSSIVAPDFIEQALKEGFCQFEWMCLRYDGTPFLLEVTLLQITLKGEDLLHITWYDITERKKAEEEASNLKGFIDSVPGFGFSKDANLIYVSGNHTFCDLLKIPYDQISGKTDYDIFPSDLASKYIEDDKHVIETGESIIVEEITFNANTDERFVVATRKHPWFDDDGNIIGLYGMGFDITELKKAEEEIQKQLSEKEILLKEVHHRLKNNINNIESLIRLQANSSTNNDIKVALQDAISRIHSIHVLYDRLLISEEYASVSIKNYVESLIDSLTDIFSINNITITKTISDFSINSKKAVSIGIIINELITNAFKHAFKEFKSGTISVKIEKRKNEATIKIHDNGAGIDDKINNEISPGLGLTIVDTLVKQLKGSYDIVNDDGTKITLTFEI